MKITDLKNRSDLADFLNIKKSTLSYILYIKPKETLYSTFEVPKKNGGNRLISSPCDELKYIQKRLAVKLTDYRCTISKNNKISHGFEKERSIMTNSASHIRKKFVLNVDLKNYFESFNFGRVRGYFYKNKNFNLPIEVATLLAQLTCYNGSLPQGAPTSPVITNLISTILDVRLLDLVKKYKLNYTRYADDLTFSTNDKYFLTFQSDFLEELEKIILKTGFELNPKKTRLMFNNSQQKVTGLVVNQKVNVDTNYYLKTRAMANNLYQNGSFFVESLENKESIHRLEGRFNYLNQVNNYLSKDIKNDGNNLTGKEKQYRKFLFFRYFIETAKPIIITEGKTDSMYLKSALKNLYKEYPKLISKNSDGTFELKISFFKRRERFSRLFGLSIHGAGSMSQFLYRFFLDNNNLQTPWPNHLLLFEEKYKLEPKNPIVFLYDNELIDKSKPLKVFTEKKIVLNKKKLEKMSISQLDEFKTKGYYKLRKNVYLLTIPMQEELKKDCEYEIEHLFNENDLNGADKVKKFSFDSNMDLKKYYGKNDLANHVMNNYKTIDFTGFKPLLNAISNVIK